MLLLENLKDELTEAQLTEIISESLKDYANLKKVLIIHPDYTRLDFTDKLTPIICQKLKNNGAKRIAFLNASGTHRKITRDEFLVKLGIGDKNSHIQFHNHDYDDPAQLITVGEIPSEFVLSKTNGQLNKKIPVTVNKLILEDHDLIMVLSDTTPHESTGYSGGLKMFFPGISGPEVIDLFHWAAALIGIPDIIATIDNPARDIINFGSSFIFKKENPMISFNMVSKIEDHRVIPKGLYIGTGFDGFLKAYHNAAIASSKIHINYIDSSLDVALQEVRDYYDEVWTAAKGSYKLQKPGVMSRGGEIIIYAPHIKCFHSNPEMDHAIREIGYHGIGYVQEFLKRNPCFSRNVAAHVINLRGHGAHDSLTKEEKYSFKVTLATGIKEIDCRSVGLGYRNPDSIHLKDFSGPGKLWIKEGGKYVFDLRTRSD